MGPAGLPPLGASGDSGGGSSAFLHPVQERQGASGAASPPDPGGVAEARTSWGYPQVHTILRRDGWKVNHKLVHRLYWEEGLTLRRKRPKRRRMAVERTEVRKTTRSNERWAMDFVHDATASGRGLRVFAAVDVLELTRFRGQVNTEVLSVPLPEGEGSFARAAGE